jgi:hypothetical protein
MKKRHTRAPSAPRALPILCAAFALALLCAPAARAQSKEGGGPDPNAGVIFGKTIMFVVKAPEGWVLDGKSGASQGLAAVSYPEGSSWKDGAAVMYVNTACRCGAKSLEEFVEGDVKRFREGAPGLKVSDGPALKLEGGQKVLVKRFSGDENGNVESVAYVDEGDEFLLFVLTARTRKDFDASAEAFDRMVSSYRFVGRFVGKD